MDIAILGCGPAGLLAAEAVVQNGYQPVIFSKKVKSQMFGAMFLHAPIDQVTPLEPELDITIIKTGTREGYAKNVYGDPDHPVSWDVIPDEKMPGWDLREAYDKLWDRYHHVIHDREIGAEDLIDIQDSFPIVYSSIPARSICRCEHEFKKQDIWVVHGDGSDHLIELVNDLDLMYYNGYPPDGSVDDTIGFDWYRYSQINQYQCWEHSKEPIGWNQEWYKLDRGEKPISTDCICWPRLRRIGRFGRWQKGQLTHHAYHQVFEEAHAGYAMGLGIPT